MAKKNSLLLAITVSFIFLTMVGLLVMAALGLRFAANGKMSGFLFPSVIVLSVGFGFLTSQSLHRLRSLSISRLDKTTDASSLENQGHPIDTVPSEKPVMAINSCNEITENTYTSKQGTTPLNVSLSESTSDYGTDSIISNDSTKQSSREISSYLQLAGNLASSLNIDDILGKALKTLYEFFEVDFLIIALIDNHTLPRCWQLIKGDHFTEQEHASFLIDNPQFSNCTVYQNLNANEVPGDTLKCADCSIFESVKIEIRAIRGLADSGLRGMEIPIKSTLCGQAVQKLKPVIRENLQEECKLATLANITPECKSQISIPLIANNHILGSIMFGYKKRHSFSDNETDLMSSLSNQIAISIENTTLFEQTRKSVHDFSVLNKAAKDLNSLLKQQDISKSTADYASELLDVDIVVVFTKNEKSGKFGIKSIKSDNQNLKEVVKRTISKELVNLIAKTHKPVVVDKHNKQYDIEIDGINSLIAMPLLYKNQLFGIICAGSAKEIEFNKNDVQLMLTIAGLSSTAMHNTYIFNQLENLYIETVKAFVRAIEAKDSYTRGHSENVAIYAVAIAQEMGLSKSKIRAIRTTALLHDIGKIGIKEEILNKPDRLNSDEYEHIKIHPQISFQILKHMPNLKDLASIVLHHHEKFNGTGYPDGLVGNKIPLESRIIAVADAFDAMTSSRPYREAVEIDIALNELIKNREVQFDPNIVDTFIYLVKNNKIDNVSDDDQNNFTREII